jgi:predicted transposase YdaD
MDDVDEELGNFLQYLADGTVSDSFTQGLSDEVTKVKQNKEWRREYMALNLREQADRQLVRAEARAEGLAEGLAEGRAEGMAEGRAEIIETLLHDGRTPEEIHLLIHLPLDEIKKVEASLCTEE